MGGWIKTSRWRVTKAVIAPTGGSRWKPGYWTWMAVDWKSNFWWQHSWVSFWLWWSDWEGHWWSVVSIPESATPSTLADWNFGDVDIRSKKHNNENPIGIAMVACRSICIGTAYCKLSLKNKPNFSLINLEKEFIDDHARGLTLPQCRLGGQRFMEWGQSRDPL